MSLIIPTFEEREEAKKERANIFETVTRIKDVDTLQNLSIIAREFAKREANNTPLPLNEFVESLDFPIIARLYDIFKNETDKYTANAQVKELLKREIDRYTGAEEEAV